MLKNLITLLVLLLMSAQAFADPSNQTVRIGDNVYTNVTPINYMNRPPYNASLFSYVYSATDALGNNVVIKYITRVPRITEDKGQPDNFVDELGFDVAQLMPDAQNIFVPRVDGSNDRSNFSNPPEVNEKIAQVVVYKKVFRTLIDPDIARRYAIDMYMESLTPKVSESPRHKHVIDHYEELIIRMLQDFWIPMANSDVTHRDLKGPNIGINLIGDRIRLNPIDHTSSLRTPLRASPIKRIYSPGYSAPEIIFNHYRKISPLSDLFSLAMTIADISNQQTEVVLDSNKVRIAVDQPTEPYVSQEVKINEYQQSQMKTFKEIMKLLRGVEKVPRTIEQIDFIEAFFDAATQDDPQNRLEKLLQNKTLNKLLKITPKDPAQPISPHNFLIALDEAELTRRKPQHPILTTKHDLLAPCGFW